MNFFINKKDIISILSDFSTILKENSVRPILSGIFISAKDSVLTFSATNLEIDLVKTTTAKINIEGEVVIKPSLILEYIKLLDIETIEFLLNDDILKIHSAEFLVLSPENYPKISQYHGDRIIEFNSHNLKSNIEKVKFAASINTDNIAISSIRLNIKRDAIHYVATDSYRLVFYCEPSNNIIERALSIPLESMTSLQKFLSDSKDNKVILSVFENYAIFSWEGTYFASRLVELNYPDYEAILENSSYSKVMEFNMPQLISSLRKVISISKDSYDLKHGAIFNFKNKKLEIKTSSGKAKLTEKLDMIKDGDDFSASLNAKYLYEFITALNIENNCIIKGNNSNAMFEIISKNNTDYKYILMPLAMK